MKQTSPVNRLRLTRQDGLMVLWVLLGLAWQLQHRYHFRKFAIDTEILMIVAANLQRGEGLLIHEYNPQDASHPISANQTAFMPGYAYLLTAVYPLAMDWMRAAWWIEIGAIVGYWLLVVIWWQRLAGRTDPRSRNLFLLFLAFALPPLHYLPIGDLLCLLGFLTGTLGLLGISSDSLSWQGIAIAALGLGFAFWVRYAYLPFLALVSLMALYQYAQHRNRLNLIKLFVAAVLTLLIAGILIGRQGFSGTNLEASGPNWFPAHLSWLEPFPFKAFFYYGLPHELALDGLIPGLRSGLKGMAFLVSAGLLGLMWRYTQGAYRFLIFATMGLNLALLGFFSLTVPPEDWTVIGFWTYLMETRYYMPGMWWVMLTTFSLAGRFPWLKGLLIGLTGITIVFALWTQYRVWREPAGPQTFASSAYPEVYQYAKTVLPKNETLMANYADSRLAQVFGHHTVPYAVLMQGKLEHAPPLHVYVLLPPEEIQKQAERSWKSMSRAHLVRKVPIGEWWVLELGN